MTANVEVGRQLPPLSFNLTRETLVRYAGASGDFNRIHYSDAAARDMGLPSVLAHGMLVMGQALRVVTSWCGDPERILSYYVRFTKPVPVPDDEEGVTVDVTAEVAEVSDGVAKVKLDARLGEDRVLGSAVVEVSL